jgi:hypothetical protein
MNVSLFAGLMRLSETSYDAGSSLRVPQEFDSVSAG